VSISHRQPSEPRTKGLAPIPLPGELALDLEAFCAAHYRAEKAEVIRRALRYFIDSRLEAEPEMRRRFLVERERLLPLSHEVVPFRSHDGGASERSDDDPGAK